MVNLNSPTEVAHGELQRAFNVLNHALFDRLLPHSLITLQRKNPRCMGYFLSRRFGATRHTDEVDEIAVNP